MSDVVADEALIMTAQMFGLPRATVRTLLQIGLPMMATLAETNPELRRRIFAASMASMPESVHDFYVHMLENPVLRQAAMDDYKATYGTMLDAANREAARRAGTTDGQARDVIAAMLPAIFQALRRAEGEGVAAFSRPAESDPPDMRSNEPARAGSGTNERSE